MIHSDSMHCNDILLIVNSCPDASILAFWLKKSLKKLKRADQVPQLRVWDLSRIFPSQPELPFLGSIPLHHHLPHLFPPSPRLTWICLPFKNPQKVKQWSVKATEELFLAKNFQRLQMTRGGRTHLTWVKIPKEGKDDWKESWKKILKVFEVFCHC